MSNKQTQSFLQNNEYVSLVATVLTIILMGIAFFSGYSLGVGKQNNKTANNPTNSSATTINTNTPAPLIEMPEIFSYTGKISAIEGNSIQFTANVVKDNQAIDKTVKATTTNSTKIIKLDISQPPIAPGSNINQSSREKEIKFSELKVGDQVVAQASENIKDKNEFETYKITVFVQGF